jgi:hypothetical protein
MEEDMTKIEVRRNRGGWFRRLFIRRFTAYASTHVEKPKIEYWTGNGWSEQFRDAALWVPTQEAETRKMVDALKELI